MFALWISRRFRDGFPLELKNSYGRDKRNLSRFGVISLAACRQCNNTWMSRLESAAKPLISAALFGETQTWDVDEQLTVATWAFKTALMLDRSNQAGWKVPNDHFEFLYTERCPPDSSQIAIARYRPDTGQEERAVSAGITKGPPSHEDGYRICFSVGQLVFSVHGYRGSGAGFNVQEYVGLPSGLVVAFWNTLQTLWPRAARTLSWPHPKGLALNNDSLDLLTDDPLMEPLLFDGFPQRRGAI